jgi:hypothetical protein
MSKSLFAAIVTVVVVVVAASVAHAQPANDAAPPAMPIDCANRPNGQHDVFFRGVIRPVRTPAGQAAFNASANLGADKPLGHRATIVFATPKDPWTFQVAEDNWAMAGDTARTITAGRNADTEKAAASAPYGKIQERFFWECYCDTHAYMSAYTNGKYPATPSATGTDSAADGYGLPVTGARAPTAANPNGLSNCWEFQTKLWACLRAHGATFHTP